MLVARRRQRPGQPHAGGAQGRRATFLRRATSSPAIWSPSSRRTGLGVDTREPTEDLALVEARDRARSPGSGTSRARPRHSGRPPRTRTATRIRWTSDGRRRRSSTTAASTRGRCGRRGRRRARIALRTLRDRGRRRCRRARPAQDRDLLQRGHRRSSPSSESTDLHGPCAVLAAAARANVTIYAFDPAGSTIDGDARASSRPGSLDPQQPQRSRDMAADRRHHAAAQLMAASMLRDLTRGPAARRPSTPTTCRRRSIASPTRAATTTCSATPRPTAKRDGRYRRIDVRVKRPGLHVRARQGYVAPDDEADAQGQAKPKSPSPRAARWPTRSAGRCATAGLALAAHAVALPVGDGQRLRRRRSGRAGDLTSRRARRRARERRSIVAIVPVRPGGAGRWPTVDGARRPGRRRRRTPTRSGRAASASSRRADPAAGPLPAPHRGARDAPAARRARSSAT